MIGIAKKSSNVRPCGEPGCHELNLIPPGRVETAACGDWALKRREFETHSGKPDAAILDLSIGLFGREKRKSPPNYFDLRPAIGSLERCDRREVGISQVGAATRHRNETLHFMNMPSGQPRTLKCWFRTSWQKTFLWHLSSTGTAVFDRDRSTFSDPAGTSYYISGQHLLR